MNRRKKNCEYLQTERNLKPQYFDVSGLVAEYSASTGDEPSPEVVRLITALSTVCGLRFQMGKADRAAGSPPKTLDEVGLSENADYQESTEFLEPCNAVIYAAYMNGYKGGGLTRDNTRTGLHDAAYVGT